MFLLNTYSDKKEKSLTMQNITDAINLLPKIPSEENLLAIIITKFAPLEGVYKKQKEKGFYILLTNQNWIKVKDLFLNKSGMYGINELKMFGSMKDIYGVPIYENDEMAFEILFDKKMSDFENNLSIF